MAAVGGQVRRGGRTEKNRKAVADAVLQLLAEGKLNFELQEVAMLSGVHRTTLYRRWPERSDLIAEAMSENASRISFDFTGNWEADLRLIAYKMRDWLLDPIEQAVLRLLAVTEDKDIYQQATRHWAPLLKRFQEPIQEAQARGELDASIDSEVLVSGIASTLTINTLFLRSSIDDGYVDRIVVQALRGCPTTTPLKKTKPGVGSGASKGAKKKVSK